MTTTIEQNVSRRLLSDIAKSIQFLSRLPVPARYTGSSDTDLTRSVWAFPLAGLIITLPALLILFCGTLIELPIPVLVVTILAIQTITTGALHEDGLADTCDGFGGGQTKQQKLDIMKDSRTGTYGVLSLVLAYLFRFSLLSALIDQSLLLGAVGFISAQIFSRASLVHFWYSLPMARADGLSAHVGQPVGVMAFTTLIYSTLFCLIVLWFFVSVATLVSILFLVTTLYFSFRHLCLRQIGGQTGDTIGAVQVIIEIAFLIGLLTFSP